MAEIYERNNAIYIRKCEWCDTLFTYDMKEYYCEQLGGCGVVACPNCKHNNKIMFPKKFKSNEEVKEDLLEQVEKLQSQLNRCENQITKLKDENKTVVEKNGKNNYELFEKETKIKKLEQEVKTLTKENSEYIKLISKERNKTLEIKN